MFQAWEYQTFQTIIMQLLTYSYLRGIVKVRIFIPVKLVSCKVEVFSRWYSGPAVTQRTIFIASIRPGGNGLG